jgi:uncharacterized membrane protein YbhN (UPF0104 family)
VADAWRPDRGSVGAVLLVTAVTAWLVATWVDPAEVREAWRTVDLGWLVASGALSAAIQVARARRAWVLLPSPPPFWAVVPSVQVGYTVNALLGVRVAILARPLLLGWSLGVEIGAATAGIVVERVLDLFALAGLIGVLSVWWPGGEPGALRWGVGALSAGLVAVLVGIAAAGPDRIRATGAALDGLPGGAAVVGAAASFASALRWLGARPDRAASAVGWTVALWAGGVVVVALGLAAMPGIGAGLGAAAAVWAAVQAACAAVPTPLAFGVYEAAGASTLEAVGVDPSVAAAALLWVHLSTVAWNLALTAVVLPFLRRAPG